MNNCCLGRAWPLYLLPLDTLFVTYRKYKFPGRSIAPRISMIGWRVPPGFSRWVWELGVDCEVGLIYPLDNMCTFHLHHCVPPSVGWASAVPLRAGPKARICFLEDCYTRVYQWIPRTHLFPGACHSACQIGAWHEGVELCHTRLHCHFQTVKLKHPAHRIL